MGNNELGELKKSHLAVEHRMDDVIELITDIEERSTLSAEERTIFVERTENLARAVAAHIDNEEAAARMTERLFSGRPLDVEQLGECARQMQRVLERFDESVDELEDDMDLEDDRWDQVRRQFGELVEALRDCSESEWKFYTRYSTLMQPGGLSS